MATIRVASINVSSFSKEERGIEVSRFLVRQSVDVCFIQETRFKERYEAELESQNLIRNDSGVGTAVALKKNIQN